MKSTIFLDPDFNFLLLENEESDTPGETKLFINVHTSAAANQRFDIAVAGASPITIYLPSNASVNFEITSNFWADDAATEITPANADGTGATLSINFPKSFDTSAALNYVNDTEFEIAAQSEAFADGIASSGTAGASGGSSTGGTVFDFVETIRNIGFRLLDEPSNVNAYFDKIAEEVQIKWTDPADIITNEPAPATWAGTVVVRKEGSAPLHRWDGVLIVDSTTRDDYASAALIDNTIDINKSYYYGIFPYDTKGDYRYTKVVGVNVSETPLDQPEISSLSVNGSDVKVTYIIPIIEGSYTSLVLVAKKDDEPASKTDGIAVNITANSTAYTFQYLNKESTYYFKIFAEVGAKSVASDEAHTTTGYLTKLVETEIRDGDMYNTVNGSRWQTQGSPTITYDSATQSMRAYIQGTNDMYFGIGGRNRTKLETLNAEIEINVPNDSIYYQLSFEVLSLWIGFLTNSESRIIRFTGSSTYSISGTPPLQSQRGEFHKVRTKVYFSSGQPYKVQIYLDGTLYQEQSFSYSNANQNIFSAYLYSYVWRTVYVKSMKCEAVFIDE